MPVHARLRLTLLTAALALGLTATAGAATFAAKPGTSSNKVLVIGTDGTRWDKLSALMGQARVPAFSRLAGEGFATPTRLAYLPPFAFTVSQVGWTTIASGVWPAKHGVTDPSNSSPGQATKNGYPDFLKRVEQAKPELSTMLVSDWGNIGTTSSGGPIFGTADAKLAADVSNAAAYDKTDESSSIAAAEQLRTKGPDASFVYFGDVDETGHEMGSESPQYIESIVRTDGRIARLLNAIDTRPTRAREHWTILIVTDHGQFDILPGMGFHGGPTDLERTSFLIGSGPGMPHNKGLSNPRIVDIVPTVLHQLGLPVQPPTDLDGRSLVSSPPPPAPGEPGVRCKRTSAAVTCRVGQGANAPLLRGAVLTSAGRRRTVLKTGDGVGQLTVTVKLRRGSRPRRAFLTVTDVTGFKTRVDVKI